MEGTKVVSRELAEHKHHSYLMTIEEADHSNEEKEKYSVERATYRPITSQPQKGSSISQGGRKAAGLGLVGGMDVNTMKILSSVSPFKSIIQQRFDDQEIIMAQISKDIVKKMYKKEPDLQDFKVSDVHDSLAPMTVYTQCIKKLKKVKKIKN